MCPSTPKIIFSFCKDGYTNFNLSDADDKTYIASILIKFLVCIAEENN